MKLSAPLILIEGLDCSGKKTIAALIAQKLEENKLRAITNIGYLSSFFLNPLAKYLTRTALQKGRRESRFKEWIKTLIYYSGFIWDGIFFRRPKDKIIIQVSSYFRVLGWAKSHGRSFLYKLGKVFTPLFVHYDLIFYVTTDYATRIKRHTHAKETKNLFRRFSSKEFYAEREKDMIALLNESKQKYFVIKNEDENDLRVVPDLIYSEIIKIINHEWKNN